MKNFSDTFIGYLVVFLALTFGGACLRYIVTGTGVSERIIEKHEVIVPNVTVNNSRNEKTCWQFLGGECTK